jgi:hypothetical protein
MAKSGWVCAKVWAPYEPVFLSPTGSPGRQATECQGQGDSTTGNGSPVQQTRGQSEWFVEPLTRAV